MLSCRFGTRARGIKNKVAVNTRLSPELLQQQLTKANARVSMRSRHAAACSQAVSECLLTAEVVAYVTAMA
jgi:hypothetical protein